MEPAAKDMRAPELSRLLIHRDQANPTPIHVSPHEEANLA